MALLETVKQQPGIYSDTLRYKDAKPSGAHYKMCVYNKHTGCSCCCLCCCFVTLNSHRQQTTTSLCSQQFRWPLLPCPA